MMSFDLGIQLTLFLVTAIIALLMNIELMNVGNLDLMIIICIKVLTLQLVDLLVQIIS